MATKKSKFRYNIGVSSDDPKADTKKELKRILGILDAADKKKK